MPTLLKLEKKSSVKREKAKQIYDNVYNTTTWRKLRAAYLMEHPLCEVCLSENITTPASEVHHKTEISNGDTIDEMKEIGFDYSNLMGLCEYHHNLIHAAKHRRNKSS